MKKIKLKEVTADDIKKALEAKLDEWEDYIREVERRIKRERRGQQNRENGEERKKM